MIFEKFLVMTCGFSLIAAFMGIPLIWQALLSLIAGFVFAVWTSKQQ